MLPDIHVIFNLTAEEKPCALAIAASIIIHSLASLPFANTVRLTSISNSAVVYLQRDGTAVTLHHH